LNVEGILDGFGRKSLPIPPPFQEKEHSKDIKKSVHGTTLLQG
jgi:hypothetical protein